MKRGKNRWNFARFVVMQSTGVAVALAVMARVKLLSATTIGRKVVGDDQAY